MCYKAKNIAKLEFLLFNQILITEKVIDSICKYIAKKVTK